MPTPAAGSSVGPLTRSDLIRQELAGKNAAIASYVDILWKVRSGAVAVVGVVVAFGAKAEQAGAVAAQAAPDILGLSRDKSIAVLAVAVAALVLDVLYNVRQWRTIHAYNELIGHALTYAVPDCPDRTGRYKARCQREDLAGLLRIVGEPHCKKGWHRAELVAPALLYAALIVYGASGLFTRG